jgi:glutamate transport system ATP-binding protein
MVCEVPLESGPGSAPRTDALLQLRRVNKHYGQLHVLQDIDLDVHAGEVVVLLGASGSGKSTLCRCVNRLETVDSGEITLDGTPIPAEGRELARLRAQVGMVFQSFNLFGHRTVLENITLAPVRVRRQPREQAEARALELLARVGLADKAAAHPAQLSGGQQQRVAIARALAMDPRLILFDEPTSG